MKRILFYYDNYCGEQAKGGTEVATARIAKALSGTGEWIIYNAFKRGPETLTDAAYSKTRRLRSKTFVAGLAEFIRENEIDAVVNMGRFYRHPKLKKAIEKSGRDTRLLFMHHFAPGNESVKHTYQAGWHLLRMNPADPKYWFRATLYPLFKLQRRLSLAGMYRKILEESDGVVLLSEGYKANYMAKAYGQKAEKYGQKTEKKERLIEKITAIPNIYDAPAQSAEYSKENRVLILSRMDEIQKQITLALKIWKKIEERNDLRDWHLDIVGTGHDEKGIKKLAERLKLKNVTFHGWQDSSPFLQKSAILMSTSLYEGLPLSMIEAGTYGCLPIAFNSYASLKDIIKDGETGVTVEKFGDIDAFAESLARLMVNTEDRKRMAGNAMDSAEKFSSRNVARIWSDTLNRIITKN